MILLLRRGHSIEVVHSYLLTPMTRSHTPARKYIKLCILARKGLYQAMHDQHEKQNPFCNPFQQSTEIA